MYSTISFVCAAGFGLFAGGLINTFSNRFSGSSGVRQTSSVPLRILTAILFGIMVLFVDFSNEWFIGVPFVTALLCITFIDLRFSIIPDLITIPGIIIAVLLRIWIHSLPHWDFIVAALLGSGLFYLIAFLTSIRGREASIGGGDIKLLFLTGLILGIKLSILSFMLFSLAGVLFGILILVTGRYKKDMTIPFGPFIAASSFFSYIWGNDFCNWLFWKLL